MRTTMKLQTLTGLALASVLAVSGCGAPPQAKEEPTWSDVYPILAGRCLHCHGAAAADMGGNWRFDFLNPRTACDGDLAQRAGVSVLSAASIASPALLSDEYPTRPRMPPEPAPMLSEWEMKTLENWNENGRDRGDKPDGNRGPTFRITHTQQNDDDVDLTYVITDPDGDPVLGEISVNDQTFPVKSSGGGTIRITNPDDAFTVTAELCDGWQTVTRERKVDL